MAGLQSRVLTVGLTNAASPVLSSNASRVALLFTGPVSGFYTLGNEATVVAGGGINVFAGGAPVEITLEKHGDVVTKAWYGVITPAVGTTGPIGFVETIAG